MYWCLRLERGIYAWQVTLDEFLPWLGGAGLLSEALQPEPTSEGEPLLQFNCAPSLRELAEPNSGPMAALFEAVAFPERFPENLRPLITKDQGRTAQSSGAGEGYVGESFAFCGRA